jgi:RNA polymerase sigma factor (sigma-70 family)
MASSRHSVALNHLCQWTAGQRTEGVPDQQLLERFVVGREEDAFTALVRRHGPMVAGVCRRVLRETHDAEDAFQATFLVLARKAASIRKGESVASWLHGVALRVSRKARVAAARRTLRERRPRPATTEPGDALTWGELRSVLDEELGQLSTTWRAPLVLCYLEGLTQDEAARRLGWSKSTLRRRLEHGRRLLHSRLARRGVTLSAGLCAPLLSQPTAAAALSNALLASTTKMAVRFGGSQLMGTETLTNSVILAESVLKSMVLAKEKLAAVVLSLSLLAAVSLCAFRAMIGMVTNAPEAPTTHSAQERNEAKQAPRPRAPVDQFGDPLPPDALARLGTVRWRHGSPAWALAFAPDGLSLASGGIDGTVHLWETATGKELLRIDNERFPDPGLGSVTGLAYAPDGKTLAGARINQPACLWDVATGKEIRQFGGEQRASWVVFSPDGKTLAYGGYQDDPIVRLADVGTGKDVHHFSGHRGRVTRVAFSPDGTILASVDNQAVHLFEVATRRSRELPGPDGGGGLFDALAFSPDGRILAMARAGQKQIRLVEVATGKDLRTLTLTGQREAVATFLFTPDSQTVISGHEDGLVRFWDVATGTKTRQFRAHSIRTIALALSPDGRTLATANNGHLNGEHAVRLWETATGKPLARHAGPQEGIAQVVFSPDSRQVATASWDGAVHVWEAATGKLLSHWQRFGRLAFLPDGQTLVCGDWSDGRVRFLDLATRKETRQFLAQEGGIYNLALARDGKTLVTAGRDRSFRLWDLATGRQLHNFGGKQKSYVLGLALSPDDKLLASLHQDLMVRIWEKANGQLLSELAEPDLNGSIVFSPDGKLLVSTSMGVLGAEPMVRLRDVATGKVVQQLRGNGGPLDAVAVSPDGRNLIWGGQHRKDLYFWEVATGQLRRKFAGHQGHLTCVAFAPNGRLMASGGSDASVLIWDVTGHRRRLGPPSPRLTPGQLERLWSDLAATDAVAAYQAICTLRASPEQAVPLLDGHLKPVPHADLKLLAEALRNLDNDHFKVRNQAAKELERLGEAAEAALRQVLVSKPSLEVRQRVEQLLTRLEGAEPLRTSRALEVLEHIGDAEARQVLAALAQGAPQARRTTEAQAALNRLSQ